MKTLIYGENIYSAPLHFPKAPQIPASPKKNAGATEIILCGFVLALLGIAIYLRYQENQDRQRN